MPPEGHGSSMISRCSQVLEHSGRLLIIPSVVLGVLLVAITVPPLLHGSPPAVGAPSASLNGEHDGDACCSVLLSPSKDNTLYEDPNGTLSNGAGDHFFAGTTNGGSIRRGVIAFDIESSIAEGATITAVTLTLHMSRTLAGSQAVGLHRLESDWGEGSSNAAGNEGSGASAQPGDATWVHTIFDSVLWNAQGGDFSATASASAAVGGIGDYTWGSNAQMVEDVQAWLGDPSTNFGWLLKGNEDTQPTAKRFDSRQNGTAGNGPELLVEYSTTPPPPAVILFSEPTYSAVERSIAKITVSVLRPPGPSEQVSVQYATEDGSAKAGRDYLPSSGTIVFSTGDTGDKTFDIRIRDDALVEGRESIKLALTDPSPGDTIAEDTAWLIISASDYEVDMDEDGFVGVRDLVAAARKFRSSRHRGRQGRPNQRDIFALRKVALNLGRPAPRPLEDMAAERAFTNLVLGNQTDLQQPDDGRGNLFFVNQTGFIQVFTGGQNVTEAPTFLDIQDRVNNAGNEEGLLGLAFDPDYRNNRTFYVYYSATDPRRSVVSRFTATEGDPLLADSSSESVILEVDQPAGNHNGGQIAFGPDGYLYIALGDGGGAGDTFGNGQNLETLLGSILRIDVNGTSPGKNHRVPEDNPFVGVPDALDEIWASGFRNPWRFSFDAEKGTLWAADVGQNKWEEVDIVKKGLNYGWNIMEGNHCFSPSTDCDQTGLELPVEEYSHGEGGCSITGGYVYRGRGTPSLLGAYVYGDFCSGKIWAQRHDGHVVTEKRLLMDSNLNITSFGQDQELNLYVLSRNDGVYRLVPAE